MLYDLIIWPFLQSIVSKDTLNAADPFLDSRYGVLEFVIICILLISVIDIFKPILFPHHKKKIEEDSLSIKLQSHDLRLSNLESDYKEIKRELKELINCQKDTKICILKDITELKTILNIMNYKKEK